MRKRCRVIIVIFVGQDFRPVVEVVGAGLTTNR
jgi:hypothetical protein